MENPITEDAVFHLWTAQTDTVLAKIVENGFSQVKTEYIDKKYGESAWIFREAYDFFKQKARHMVKPPEGAESPIWLSFDKTWLDLSGSCRLIELAIPRSRIMMFHRDRWNRVLNLSYVGRDAEEEAAFERKMEQMGVAAGWEVFRTGYYPYLKSEIKKSWERIFELDEEVSDWSAAVWQIRREDIVKVDGEPLHLEKG